MEAMKRIAQCGFGFLLSCALLALSAGAQNSGSQNQGQSSAQAPSSSGSSSGSSLADYARQVRKDPSQPKAKPRVFDNDNLPKEDKLSIVGQPSPATAEGSANAKPADTAAKTSEPGATAGAPASGE